MLAERLHTTENPVAMALDLSRSRAIVLDSANLVQVWNLRRRSVEGTIHLSELAAVGFIGASDDILTLGPSDNDRALAEFNQAIQLAPNNASPVAARGHANFDLGNYQTAASDFSHAVTLEPDTPETIPWLYIAQARLGIQTSITDLTANAARAKSTKWPYPIIEMFLGRRTEQATLEAGGSPSELCEAQFFVAERLLLRENRTAAIDRLRSAVDTCPKPSVTLLSVQAELKRITR
jgi:lipoprotein NlpI